MAGSGGFLGWVSLLLSRFGRGKNLEGDCRSVEAAAIPTVTMIADWAKNERSDVSEMWVFGSAVDGEGWNALEDDVDILLVVPDKLWKSDLARDIPREAPLSEQYLKTDIRVKRESDCEPWRTQAMLAGPAAPVEEGRKMSTAEHAMRTGVCVWRRPDEEE